MKKTTIAFISDDCKSIKIANREYFVNSLSDFGAGTKLKITYEHYHKQRSLKQNNSLYFWVDLLAEELSIEPERLK